MCRDIPPPREMSNKGGAIGGVSRNYVCAILTLKQNILALEFFWNFISNLILIDFFSRSLKLHNIQTPEHFTPA